MYRNNRGPLSNGNRPSGYPGRSGMGMQRGNAGCANTMNRNNDCNMNRTSMCNMPVCDNSCANVCNSTPDCMDTEVVVLVKEDGCAEEESAGCRPSRRDPLAGMPLAMAYVPWQDYEETYSKEEAWERGTIFCQLDLEFMARRCN